MDNAMYESLAEEIYKITTAPYIVSLKRLHDILTKSHEAILQRWADNHPCQNLRLASAVIGAWNLWPYAVDILRSLAEIPALRDALIAAEPALLDIFLSRATDSPPQDDKIRDVCTVLLSRPVSRTPLPACTQTFFVQSFNSAASSPSSDTIRPIYRLLNGACKDLLPILHSETTTTFQDHLLKIMRSIKTVKDQSLGLLCLGVLAIMVESSQASHYSQVPSDPSNALQSTDSETTAPATIAAARQLFSGAKASKTMHLLVLRVIYACRSHTDFSHQDAIESIQLANRALRAVDPISRKEWVGNNVHVVRKLHEKVLKAETGSPLLLEAFVFVGILADRDTLSAEMIRSYHDLLMRVMQGELYCERSTQTLAASLALYSLDQGFLARLLQQSLLYLSRQSPSNHQNSQILRSLLRQLTDCAQEYPNIRKGLLMALSTNEVGVLLGEFIRSTFPPGQHGMHCDGAATCRKAQEIVKQGVGLALCQLLLTAALAAQTDDISMPTSIAVALLNKHQQLANQPVSCTIEAPALGREIPNAVSFTRPGSLLQLGTNCNWKDRLSAHLALEAKHVTDSLLHGLVEVCQHLEERCETAEIPLRDEQARCASLGLQIAAEKSRLDDMEAHSTRQKLYVDAVEAEKATLEAELDNRTANNEELMRRVDDLEEEMRISKNEAERSVVATREEWEKQRLELVAAIMSKDEIIEQQSKNERDFEAEVERLQGQLKTVEQLSDNLKHDNTAYQALCAELEALLESEKDNTTMNAVALKHHSSITAELNRQLQALQDEVETGAARIKSLLDEIQTARTSHSEEMTKLESSHDLRIQELEAEATKRETAMQEQLRLRDNDIRTAEAKYDAQVNSSRLKIEALEDKVNALLAQCENKDEELLEAQELRARLMSAMGLGNTVRSKHGIQEPNPLLHHHQPQRRFVRVDTDVANEDHLTGSASDRASSFGSSSSTGGPTPKRTKPRKESKVPKHQQRKSLPARAFMPMTAGRSPNKRQPLKDVSFGRMNLSPVRPFSKVISKGNAMAVKSPGGGMTKQGLGAPMIHPVEEDEPFEDSEFLSSTQVPNVRTKPEEIDFLDETTAEL